MAKHSFYERPGDRQLDQLAAGRQKNRGRTCPHGSFRLNLWFWEAADVPKTMRRWISNWDFPPGQAAFGLGRTAESLFFRIAYVVLRKKEISSETLWHIFLFRFSLSIFHDSWLFYVSLCFCPSVGETNRRFSTEWSTSSSCESWEAAHHMWPNYCHVTTATCSSIILTITVRLWWGCQL